MDEEKPNLDEDVKPDEPEAQPEVEEQEEVVEEIAPDEEESGDESAEEDEAEDSNSELPAPNSSQPIFRAADKLVKSTPPEETEEESDSGE